MSGTLKSQNLTAKSFGGRLNEADLYNKEAFLYLPMIFKFDNAWIFVEFLVENEVDTKTTHAYFIPLL